MLFPEARLYKLWEKKIISGIQNDFLSDKYILFQVLQEK